MSRFFLILLLGWLLSGCTQPPPPAGTLRVGLGAQPATLDPHLAQGLAELRVLTALYQGLVLPFPDAQGNPLSPGVAQSWTVSSDGRQVTFYLRSSARWSNGQPITSSDFIDSWQRALAPGLAGPNAALFDPIQGARAYRLGQGSWAQVGLRAPTASTLVVTLQQPTPGWVSTLTHPIFFPLYQARSLPVVRGQAWITPGQLVSNGPFTLQSVQPYHRTQVVRNPLFQPTALLQSIQFYPIENRSSEEMAFLSGALDVTMSLPLSKVHAYRQANDPRLRIDPALQVGYLLINVRQPPLSDVRVRRLLSLSLDRGALCQQILRAGQTPATTFVPPPLQEGPQRLREDLKEAQELLSSLPPQLRASLQQLQLHFNTSEARKLVAEGLQDRWQQSLGLSITLTNLEWKTFLAQRQAGQYQLAQAGWSADSPDAGDFLRLFASDNPNNSTGWSSAAYDEALRQRQWARAEAILLEELPCIPLFFTPNIYLLSPRVRGWQGHPLDYHNWATISVNDA